MNSFFRKLRWLTRRPDKEAELRDGHYLLRSNLAGGDPAVLNYYRNQVIGGRTAFVLPADKAETLVQVFAMKFVSEIALHIEPAVRPDRL